MRKFSFNNNFVSMLSLQRLVDHSWYIIIMQIITIQETQESKYHSVYITIIACELN